MTANLETKERFWSVKFADKPYEIHAWGTTPLTAISGARQEVETAPNSGALVRPAVFGELDWGTEHFTNGGDFIRDTSRPCRECSEPVPFHHYKEELGYCLECSNKYWNGELE